MLFITCNTFILQVFRNQCITLITVILVLAVMPLLSVRNVLYVKTVMLVLYGNSTFSSLKIKFDRLG